MGRVTLNIDAGELPDEPEELYALAHLVHVACGGHAGDAGSIRRAVDACILHGTELGAHPSYPDRAGFGRARMELSAEALAASVRDQCEALREVAEARGARVTTCKLHGALYHAANADRVLAEVCVGAVRRALGDAIAMVGPARGELGIASDRAGLRYLTEGFADRGTRPDGSLVPRGEAGALVTDPELAAARARVLFTEVDTICVHGDTAGAIAIARAVRRALDDARA